MYVCMYDICIYIYVCIYLCVYMYVCMCECVYVIKYLFLVMPLAYTSKFTIAFHAL